MNELYPFQGHYLERPGGRYHYLDEGRGAAVVMVHGNPTWSFYYRRLVLALRDRHRVIVPDHMGCGRSSRPDDARYEYTLENRIADLEALIDHLDLPRVSLVVHDWGGMIGVGYAARHPERVERLVVSNTAAFHRPAGKALPWKLHLCRSAIGALLVRGLNLFLRGALRQCVTRSTLSPLERAGYLEPYGSWHDRIALHRFITDIPVREGDRAWSAVSDIDVRLHALRGHPMLILWGERDFVFDADYLGEWQRRFPGANLHRFPDCGHWLLDDAHGEVIPLVQRFLARPAEEAA